MEKIIFIYLVCLFQYSKENPSQEQIQLFEKRATFLYTLKEGKIKKKNEKKIFGLQLFGTSAGLRNTLKMNERILTKVKRKSKRIFDTLKLLRLFNIQDQNVRKSQEIP